MEKGQYIKFRYGGRLFNIRVKQNTINKSVEEKNKLKEEYIDWKKTLKCNRCGISDHRVLQFHHHRDKESEISTMLSRGFSLTKIKLEADKCEVLCANCHFIEHYEQKGKM
jgi:hypothetical protein